MIYRKIILSVLIIALLNLLGCYSYKTISKDEFTQAEDYNDLQVLTNDKNLYQFEEDDYTFRQDSIYGSGKLKLRNGQKVSEDFKGSIHLEDIKKLQMDKLDVGTTILVIAIPVVLIVIFAVTADFSITSKD